MPVAPVPVPVPEPARVAPPDGLALPGLLRREGLPREVDVQPLPEPVWRGAPPGKHEGVEDRARVLRGEGGHRGRGAGREEEEEGEQGSGEGEREVLKKDKSYG